MGTGSLELIEYSKVPLKASKLGDNNQLAIAESMV